MRYLIKISYDGSKFYGFQRLNGHKTVQGELERVLTKINKTVVVVKGAGRTDRGVHAYDQGVSFDLTINITPEGLKSAMNSLLDSYIYVNKCIVVNNDFHARFDVKSKTYQYIINLGEYDPIINDYVYNYNRSLDIKNMKKASTYLLGMHNYEAFTSGERESYNSIIYNIKINKKKDLLYITFTGKSFYRYMVRNMVGALVNIGMHKNEPIVIKDMLNSRTNTANYMTVPANGLYLNKVEY
jgi:tRNA pseudouridine38-40 synthase